MPPGPANEPDLGHFAAAARRSASVARRTALRAPPPCDDRQWLSGQCRGDGHAAACRPTWRRAAAFADDGAASADCDLAPRSEEHTSELQSLMRRSYAVFCLKKKTMPKPNATRPSINSYN